MTKLLVKARTLYESLMNQEGLPSFDTFLLRLQQDLSTPALRESLMAWWENIHSFGWLAPYFKDEQIREILIHGPTHSQYDSGGPLKEIPLPSPLTREDLQLALEILTFKNQIHWNFSHPFASFSLTLNDRAFRATLIHFSLTPQKESKLFLRKISPTIHPLEHFALGKREKDFLGQLVSARKNILIAGPTSSGKTSFLRSLLDLVPSQEHVVIMEDTHEIESSFPSRTHLLADPHHPRKSLVELCSYALRLRPDRILLGEIRHKEIIPFFLSMNTGHRGLLSTLHANSAYNSLSRCALLMALFSENKDMGYSLSLDLVCQNLDYIVYLEGKRVKEMVKILGSDQGRAMIEQALP